MEVSDWMLFKRRPADPGVQHALMQLTGVAIDDLFPDAVYAQPERISHEMTVVRDVSVRALAAQPGGILALPSAETQLLERERLEMIASILTLLPPKFQQIIRHRFGFDDGQSHTLYETGKLMGISIERTRQIEAQALRMLHFHGRRDPLQRYLEG